MPDQPDIPICFQTLYRGPLVRLSTYDCHATRGGPGMEEMAEANALVLLRRGVFCRHVEGVCLTADVNQAAFFPAGAVYRVSHPVDGGDVGTVFAVSPAVLDEMAVELDPWRADRRKRLFPFLSGPCDSEIFWRHRALLRRLAEGGTVDPFWVEETALSLVADLLKAAFARHALTRPDRRGTRASHADLAETVKHHLSATLGQRLTLSDLARAVHSSPYHLARIFQQHAGVPIHRYLTLLRLRSSLEHLWDGRTDITALALDLGFSSHSHFTGTFHREFGCAPSAIRKGSRFRESSKNLEV